MKLQLGRARSALIVAPHPDDEVIGAGHLMAALAARGARVAVAIVTDGTGSHPGSEAWPAGRLAQARRLESRRALFRLGFPASSLHFLGLVDGGVMRQVQACRRALQRLTRRLGPFDLIVGPAADDDHSDHRAVARALTSEYGSVRRISYRVWPPRTRIAQHDRMLYVAGSALAKRSLIRMYRTQLGAIRDDPAGFAIAPHELRRFAHPLEMFRDDAR